MTIEGRELKALAYTVESIIYLCFIINVSFTDLADFGSIGTLPAKSHMTTGQKQTVSFLTGALYASVHVAYLLTWGMGMGMWTYQHGNGECNVCTDIIIINK